MSDAQKPRGIRLRLPATSANLGPGFDAVAVALDVYLELEAEPAEEFSIAATGRDAQRCARIEDNLILEAYRKLLHDHGRPIVPLAIRMVNGIPLGMGWVVPPRQADWRPLRWLITLGSLDGRTIGFLKRLTRSKGILTMWLPAGWADS